MHSLFKDYEAMRKNITGCIFSAVIIAAMLFFFENAGISLSEDDTARFVTEQHSISEEKEENTESFAEKIIMTSEGQPEWSLLKKTVQYKDMAINILTGQEVRQEGSVLAGYISVKSEGELLLYSQGEVCVGYYNQARQYISGEQQNPHYGCLLSPPEECCYIRLSFDVDVMDKSFLVQTGGPDRDVLIVSKEGIGYSSIGEAVFVVRDEGIIFILPGIYQEQVKAWGKNVSLYGMDREKCILESYSSSYYSPPLEISCGYVTNLSIRAVDKYHQTSTLYAYGVHIEDHSLTNKTLRFENCNIYSDFNSAVGIGLRGGCEVEFVNVQMTGKENGMFCHDSAYSSYKGVQNISLINCQIEGMEGNQALRFDSQGIAGSVINVRLIDNVLINGNSEGEETLLYTRNNGGAGTEINWQGLKNYYLTRDSIGNNVHNMNFTK